MKDDIENNNANSEQQPSPPEAAPSVDTPLTDSEKLAVDDSHTQQTPTSTNNDQIKKGNSSNKDKMIHFVAMLSLLWGVVMTSLYIHELNKLKQEQQQPPIKNSGVVVDDDDDKTTFRSLDGPNHLGVGAISHINVVVNDSIDMGSQYYQDVLGFEPAYNDGGKMEYRNITNYGFCVDAGFENELFYYYKPNDGNKVIELKKTYDASGGIRHVALEVLDAVDTYNKLKSKPNHQGTFITKDTPIPLDPFPYTFFYWIDKYAVQWEFEQGRPVEYYHVAGITG